MSNDELIEKLKTEKAKCIGKMWKLDHYLTTKQCNEEDSYYIGLVNDERDYLNHLAVIIDLRVKYLRGGF